MTFDTGEHIVSSYDEKISELRRTVLEMGTLAREQLDAVSMILGEYERAAALAMAGRVFAREERIDQCDNDAERAIELLLALRAPLAGDLRHVLSLTNAARELERIGDECRKIAALGSELGHRGTTRRSLLEDSVLPLLPLATALLDDALTALRDHDVDFAQTLLNRDDALDKAFRKALNRLSTVMSENPAMIQSGIDLVQVAKALERIGDHCENIAEHIVFCVRGKEARYAAYYAALQAQMTGAAAASHNSGDAA